jgi:hypothetical protein
VTSPPTHIQVECPRCGRQYEDWYRASINLDLEGWHADDPEVEQYLRECSTATCPGCGHVVELDTLVVEGNLWRSGTHP